MPTGTYETGSPHYKGYSSLDARVIKAVADSLAQVDQLLASGHFTALAYSWSKETRLGGRIFNTAQVVRDHIVDCLEITAAKREVSVIRSEFSELNCDGDFSYMITRQPKTLFIFNDNEEEFYAHYTDPANPYWVR